MDGYRGIQLTDFNTAADDLYAKMQAETDEIRDLVKQRQSMLSEIKPEDLPPDQVCPLFQIFSHLSLSLSLSHLSSTILGSRGSSRCHPEGSGRSSSQ